MGLQLLVWGAYCRGRFGGQRSGGTLTRTRDTSSRLDSADPSRARTCLAVPGLSSLGLALLLSSCSGSPSILDSSSPDAQRIERLWWILLAIAAGVFVVVLWLLIGSLIRARTPDEGGDGQDERVGRRIVLWGGLIGTSAILIVVMVISTLDLQALTLQRETALDIRVTGEQYWWRVEYPEHGVVTANEIHVPAGEDVTFILESGDVIHSFWVPQAGPKRDMIPGSSNELTLRFNDSRVYRGVCAEFCGLQHAHMQLLVVSQPRPEFDAWLAGQTAEAAQPGSDLAQRGRKVFAESQCVGCHTVRGVSSAGDAGPDLTHLASRRTIAAGVFDLTHENLTSFVSNPDTMKPGVLMPPAGLDPEELEALIAYLESLR